MSSVRLWHNTRGTGIPLSNYDARYVMPSDVMSHQSHTPNTKMKIHLFVFLSFLSETAVLAAAVVLHNSTRLFYSAVFRGTHQCVTCSCMHVSS